MNQSAEFLLVRSDDLVILGVHFSGFETRAATEPGMPPMLEALVDDASVVLMFPPQAIAEEKFSLPGDITRRGASLAKSSHITFAVEAGTRIALSVQGVLDALTQAGPKIVMTGTEEPTAIELPWRLIVAAHARSGGSVISTHPALPITSPSGVVGLWRARLRAREDGTDTDARLALLPLRVEPDEGGLDTAPLSEGQRQTIVSVQGQADVRRLELSALGGSLSAKLVHPAIEWEHDTTLGRDHKVHVVSKGVLYPFGHRAEYQELAERVFDPLGAQAVAGLHRHLTLVITEPVRDYAHDDPRLARQFPFSEVEILASSFSDLKHPRRDGGPGDWQLYQRTPFPPDALQTELNTITADEQALAAAILQGLAELPQSIQQMLDMGFGSAPLLLDAQSTLR